MTAMAPGPVDPDFLLSYARRDGDDVRVVLVLPRDADLDDAPVFVRFEQHDSGFRAAAELTRTDGTTRVEVSVPREQLTDGLWHLKLRQRNRPLRNLRARVLLHGDQPLALLFGKTSNIT
jgi:hypothetical protein